MRGQYSVAKPLAGEVEIDEDVDFLLTDEIDQLRVIELEDVDERLDRVDDALLLRRSVARRIVQDRDLETAAIVPLDRADKQMAGRVVAKLGRKIGDFECVLGAALADPAARCGAPASLARVSAAANCSAEENGNVRQSAGETATPARRSACSAAKSL